MIISVYLVKKDLYFTFYLYGRLKRICKKQHFLEF